MKAAKVVAWICLVAMTAGLINGFVNGDFLVDGAALLANPWGVMSMIDLYVGFTLFSLWIIYRENQWWVAMIWVVAMMILGFFTGALYLLIALYSSQDSWNYVLLGKHAVATK
jgi:Ca2+/Na+ antiporter